LRNLDLNDVYEHKGYVWPGRPPASEDLDQIMLAIAKRVSRYRERARYLYMDRESAN